MVKCTLVLFAKPPVLGVAKTRLAVAIGADAAALVAEALLADTLALCETVTEAGGSPDIELILAYTDDRDYFASAVSDRWRLLRQEGAHLGERLENALAALRPSSDDATVFVGMDAPHLPQEFLRRAFDALREFDTVLGPCEDGGYYLVGVRGIWPRGILAGVRWSTEHALDDTRAAFEHAGLGCATLPEWYDIDDVESLGRLAADLETLPPDALPHVRAALATLGDEWGTVNG